MSYVDRDAVCYQLEKLASIDSQPRAIKRARKVIFEAPSADVLPVPNGNIGEVSDGYHTFNGLYYQRMVLFAALVIAHNDKAWKSWKHEDGNLCFDGGWFIVGIDTPQGSYTYHYEDKYWNWFECEELPVAKHWDGHTEEDVTRLLSLDVRPVVRCQDCIEADYSGVIDKGLIWCNKMNHALKEDGWCAWAVKQEADDGNA